ncbi:MAG: acyl-CoA thioesterase [Gammaproteobacteria bacterium]|jgi:acyl-CoA thioesterase
MSESKADELARACGESMYERDVAAQNLGISVHEIRSGYASLKMKVRADMLNGHEICHGGFLFALADTAFAFACNSYNKITVAQHCEIDFVQPGREGDELLAVAVERQRGGRTGLYDVMVSRLNGEVLAHFRGRSYQIRGEVIKE